MNSLKLRQLLHSFFLEDIGDRDVTSEAIFTAADCSHGQFLAKQSGIFAGEAVMKEGFQLLADDIQINMMKKDGEWMERGDVIATVEGPVQSILTGERVILNLIQRMSGIATMTHRAVKTLDSDKTKICDTRKTTPGLRMLEKYAVQAGGGVNHRFGLYDGVMLKDNHIAHVGSITEAVQKVRDCTGHMMNIEVEVETKEQLEEAIAANVDIIMFDNCSPETIKSWLPLVPNHIITEASGGITLENLSSYKGVDVDYISLGALTHSVQSIDISLNMEGKSDEFISSTSTNTTC
ncbi:carboxylating nicotinate-nucleotide diphosphorylase [Priestia megaterium]|nr:carboxylating nicotinate-nucleotide diphosphorylase [Priestia megaterium]